MVANIEKEIFTEHEKELLLLLAKGFCVTEIADMLKISKYTIYKHCKNVYKKLGAKNSTNAVCKAFKKKLLPF